MPASRPPNPCKLRECNYPKILMGNPLTAGDNCIRLLLLLTN